MYNDEGKIIMEAEFMLQITTFPFYLKMGKSRGRLEQKKKKIVRKHGMHGYVSNVYNSN